MRFANGDDTQPLTVEAFENHVYFYSMIDTDRCLALMQKLHETERYLLTEKLTRNKDVADPIWLHIQSGGGDIFAAFSVADQIKQMHLPVYSIVEGYVASAATVISTSCNKRYIHPHAFMMIHQISTWFMGTHEELKDEFALMEMLSENMYEWYVKHTKLTKDELQEKIKRNCWMTAEQAVEWGFADEVYDNH